MKLTPMASMRINTCPGPGTGIDISAVSSTSGPPVARIWMAFITGARMLRKGGGLQVKQGLGARLGTKARRPPDAHNKSPAGIAPSGAVVFLVPGPYVPSPCLSEVPVRPIAQDAGLFRGAQADEAIDGIRRALLVGVIMAHLQLAEQADGQHLDARHDEH